MKNIDLSDYNVGELKGLLQQIENEIASRRGQEAKDAREKILKIASDLGMTVDQLLGKTGKTGGSNDRSVNKVSVKYRNLNNAADQWTGRGRRPKWLVDALDNGKNIEDFGV